MTLIKLNVKHASKVHEVSIDVEKEGLQLKQELERLTNVPVARQKVMVKGRQLQDSVVLSSLSLKDGQAMFMLGSVPAKEKPPVKESESKATTTKPVDDADSEDEIDDAEVPVGLANLGNTCYANATLEALRTVPELNTMLTNYKGSDRLIQSWGKTVPQFGHMAPYYRDSCEPTMFLQALRQRFPQFGEIGEGGFPKQQDAEEFWTLLLSEVAKAEGSEAEKVAASFEGRFSVKSEKGGLGPEFSEESFSKLMCHITIRTNFLKDGLKASLVDEINHEDGINQTVNTKRISKLPKYLTVQFVRFFWRRDTQKNSKILRKVTFPLNLDIGDLCTDELQEVMAPARQAYRELESAIEEHERSMRRAKFRRIDTVPADPADTGSDSAAVEKRKAAEEADKREEEREQEKLNSLRESYKSLLSARADADATSSPHGLYELEAVVTHQGMSADSGHYQCFTRNHAKPDSWWRFNDDKVSEVDEDRIAQLAGGGASDSALILLYKSSEDEGPSKSTHKK